MGAIIVNLLCNICIALAVVSAISVVSVITQSNMFTMAISTALIIIPCLAVYAAENIRIGYCIANNYVASLIIVLIFSVAVSIAMSAIVYLKFTNSGMRRT